MLSCFLFRLCSVYVFFFFKQKTAYELRISDWSSDVCSSDLLGVVQRLLPLRLAQIAGRLPSGGAQHVEILPVQPPVDGRASQQDRADQQIGRASCRERVCQYV